MNLDPEHGARFVGREREMGILESRLDDALSGRGRLVVLSGEPGIGKTRTSQELAHRAQEKGFQVHVGWCYEGEGAPAYWPWVQAIRSYVQLENPEHLSSVMGPGAADIAELVPELRRQLPGLELPPALDPEQARFRLFDSITTFLKNAAALRPVMLVLDDLHWADRPSLLVLEFLARGITASSIFIVGCYRDAELSRQHPLAQSLAQLSRYDLFGREHLSGLNQQDTEELIEAATGVSAPPELVETVYAQTEGNPFFTREVIRLLAERGELSVGRVGQAGAIGIPQGVREVVGQRLGSLSEECYQTLTTASVIGREFDFSVLKALNEGVDDDQLLSILEEALSARIVEELPGQTERFQFSHALIRDTLASQLSAARRSRLHARVGEVLEVFYGPQTQDYAAELAYHFSEAVSVSGSEPVIRYSRMAGERALATYAYEDALSHFQRAQVAGEGRPVDAEAAAVLFGLGRSQAALQSGEALNSLRSAFEYYAEVGDVDRVVAIAEYPDYGTGTRQTGIDQLIGRALDVVPVDSHHAGRLLSRHGQVLGLQGGHYQRAKEAFARALVIARREGDSGLEMQTLAAAASVSSNHMQYDECLEESLKAIELAGRVQDPRAEVAGHYFAVTSLTVCGDLASARRHASAMLEPAEKLRDRFWLTGAFWKNEIVHRLGGDWGAARAFGDRALAISDRPSLLLADLVLLECEVGDALRGMAYLRRLMDVAEADYDFGNIALVISVSVQISGDMRMLEAADTAAESVLASTSTIPSGSGRARIGAALLAVHRGDMTAAAEHYVSLEPRRSMMWFWSISGDRVLGLLARTMGEIRQAEAHFQDGLAFCRKAGYRPELAWVCHDYAEAILAGAGGNPRLTPGDVDRTRALLAEAFDISSDLHMLPLKEKVITLQSQADNQPTSGPAYPDGLTHREVEVLQLIAQGKSNRDIASALFISPNTAGHHVSNILSKTGSSNRAELATYATRRNLLS